MSQFQAKACDQLFLITPIRRLRGTFPALAGKDNQVAATYR